jgi:hypothetical protein
MNDYIFQRLKHLFRFRRKRGYGIHSPFVFELVTSVIREKAEYYAFREIEPLGTVRRRDRACCRLLFRLAEREGYRRVLLVGTESDAPARYLKALSDKMLFLDERDGGARGEWDLLYIGRKTGNARREEWERWLKRRGKGRVCVVIMDIHANRVNRMLWKRLREESRVAVDMMWYGLLFFDHRLQPGRYAL